MAPAAVLSGGAGARFAPDYDSRYAKGLGNFRIERISRVATRFLTCGDYPLSGSGVYSRRESCQSVARIRCVNTECRLEYFRPFSCKGFFLCPSCSQKRTLLFAEYLDEQLLLALPHRQAVQRPALGFVFTLPKALRAFLRHDQRLFAKLARLIFNLDHAVLLHTPGGASSVTSVTQGPSSFIRTGRVRRR